MIRQTSYAVYAYRNGVRYRPLRCISAPTITANLDGPIKTSCTVELLEDASVDWLSDELRPFWILDGVEYPFGAFRAATVTEDVTDQGRVTRLEAYDKCYLLQANRTETILHLDAGDGYIQTVHAMLTACGVTLARITSSDKTLQTDREDWNVGTSYLDIINTLLGEINYADVWFDVDGYAVLEPVPELTAANIKHTYDSSNRASLLRWDNSRTTDAWDKANVFVVICSNPDLDEPLTATAVNDNAFSPLSTFRRGMRVVQVTKVDNIASQADLEDYAARLCSESTRTGETVTVQTAITPDHGVGDVVALNLNDLQGIYQETGWSVTLGTGQLMKHTLRRVLYG